MATYIAEIVDYDGLAPTYHAADTVDYVSCGRGVFLHIVNADSNSTAVSIVTPRTINGIDILDPTVVVPAGESRFVGPITRQLFADPANSNLATLEFSNITDVTYAVVRMLP